MVESSSTSFVSNYVIKPDRFSSHARIGRHIRGRAEREVTRPYRVLDIGCASGFLRHFLPAPDFYLVGVDREPAYVERAREVYDEVYLGDLEAGPLPLPTRYAPDAMVFADVLEHLADPVAVLADSLKRLLPAGKPVIISVPNFAHLYVRLVLLAGQFEYANNGLLDRTHLRFYTIRSALRLCAECHVQVQGMETTPVPLPKVHPAFEEGAALFPLHALNAKLASAFNHSG